MSTVQARIRPDEDLIDITKGEQELTITLAEAAQLADQLRDLVATFGGWNSGTMGSTR